MAKKRVIQLRTPLSPVVGVLLDTTIGFGRDVFRGAVRYARTQTNWRFYTKPQGWNEAYRDWPCDAFIVNVARREHVRALRRIGKPIVNISGFLHNPGLPTVETDHLRCGELAARHFLERGFRQFATYFDRPSARFARMRSEGFAQELARAGYACGRFPGPFRAIDLRDDAAHWDAVRAWVKSLPPATGLFAVTDTIGMMLCQCCHEMGRLVPEELAVIGVDNDLLICDSSDPPLSSVACNHELHGYRAAELLDGLLRGRAAPAGSVLIPPVRVVPRQSSDVMAIDEPTIALALRLIRDHACDPMNVDDLVGRLPVARRWLERNFRRLLGRSPHDQIIRVRLEHACVLLRETQMKVPEIAEQCGCTHVQNFGKLFRQKMGLSPSAWRGRNRLP